MINRLSNAINRNRSAAKISKVMSSSLLPSPRSNFADLRQAGDLRIFVNFGPILNLIRRRVNIKFSAPSKIKLRSLP